MRALGLIWVYALSVGLGGLATSAYAGEGCCQAKLNVAIQKVDQVLADWKTHLTAVENGCQEKAAQQRAARTELANACPIGSRMHETLRFVNESLAAARDAEGICAEACKARGGVKKDATAMALMAKRSELLTKLHLLSGYTQEPASTGAETAQGFCADKAQKLATEIRKTECNASAAKLLVAEVPGLQCEKKAAGIVASIKGAGCEKSAANVVLAAANDLVPAQKLASAKKEECAKKTAVAKEECASKKAALASAKSFCPDKAQKLATEIRKTECNASAAKLLVAEVPGLQCEKKAAGIVASIKGAGCEKSATNVVLAAANELAPTTQQCATQFSTKGAAIMASLDVGAAAYGKMCVNSRGELHAKFVALAQTDPAVALMQPTLMTLGEGLAALTELDARMAEYVQSKPELTKGLTPESMAAYKRSVNLVSGANDVMQKVHAVMFAGTEEGATSTGD